MPLTGDSRAIPLELVTQRGPTASIAPRNDLDPTPSLGSGTSRTRSCRSDPRSVARTAIAVLVVTSVCRRALPSQPPPRAQPVASSAEEADVRRQATRRAAALPTRCTELGIYRDDPVGTFPSLARSLGPNVTTVSTYVTAGSRLDPRLVALARAKGLRLLVTWMPDDGTDETYLPGYSLANITGGVLDNDLRALARELKAAGVPVLFRPMPEPNTPWYAWSGTVNGNTPAEYVLAWKHVRKVVREVAGYKVSFLWSPYVRSVPETDANAIKQYFPGSGERRRRRCVGYNFGATGSLTWTDPKALFMPAYTTIQALAAEAVLDHGDRLDGGGGSQTAWIASLRTLKASMPMLRGVVWFDVADPQGDFRLGNSALRTTKSLLKGRCIV